MGQIPDRTRRASTPAKRHNLGVSDSFGWQFNCRPNDGAQDRCLHRAGLQRLREAPHGPQSGVEHGILAGGGKLAVDRPGGHLHGGTSGSTPTRLRAARWANRTWPWSVSRRRWTRPGRRFPAPIPCRSFHADDRAAAVVADGPGENLRRAGAVLVDHHHQRHPPLALVRGPSR